MSALDTLARLRRFNEEVRDRDPHLAEESLETARLEVSEVAASGAPPQDETELESIVMRKQRPVLAIRDNDAVLDDTPRGLPAPDQTIALDLEVGVGEVVVSRA